MKRLKQSLSKILGIDENVISEALTPADVETWDSFNALLMVTELETVFNVKFTAAEVVSVKCVGDIRKVLEGHGVRFNDG
jgi:acyl carrier protein